MFALVDCNCFYVSCERVFQPYLEGKPVIVLSSNDGCAISRSNEAKALGIPMGVPLFKIKDLVKSHNVSLFSSNFSLYGDMSSRVMATLRTLSPALEVYSIDEAFLDLTMIPPHELFSHGSEIKKIVKTWTGIPVSVGIAPTKTLAKVANHFAKRHSSGCHVLLDKGGIEKILNDFPVEEVWGIGRKWAKKLSTYNIHTALELSQKDTNWLNKTFNVVLARTSLELRGISCLNLEEMVSPKKSITSSRSFGHPITSLEILREAVSYHASLIAQKLRKQKSKGLLIHVSIRTSYFKGAETSYANGYLVTLSSPSQDTSTLIKAALFGLEKIFLEGIAYKKACVSVFHLSSEDKWTPSLFDTISEENSPKRKLLLQTLDQLNAHYGKRSVIFASEGFGKSWAPQRSWKSKRFTTCWEELLEVR